MSHPNSRMTPAGRHQPVLAIEGGASYREAAAMMDVAISTISVWVNRWRAATEAERAGLHRARPVAHNRNMDGRTA